MPLGNPLGTDNHFIVRPLLLVEFHESPLLLRSPAAGRLRGSKSRSLAVGGSLTATNLLVGGKILGGGSGLVGVENPVFVKSTAGSRSSVAVRRLITYKSSASGNRMTRLSGHVKADPSKASVLAPCLGVRHLRMRSHLPGYAESLSEQFVGVLGLPGVVGPDTRIEQGGKDAVNLAQKVRDGSPLKMLRTGPRRRAVVGGDGRPRAKLQSAVVGNSTGIAPGLVNMMLQFSASDQLGGTQTLGRDAARLGDPEPVRAIVALPALLPYIKAHLGGDGRTKCGSGDGLAGGTREEKETGESSCRCPREILTPKAQNVADHDEYCWCVKKSRGDHGKPEPPWEDGYQKLCLQ